jgi:hypothetical protein
MGQLFQTTVLPDPHAEEDPGYCGDVVTLSTCYNITLELDAGGTVEISFLISDIDFWVHWLHNVWLCGEDAGNLRVLLRTRISQEESEDTQLCNPSVDTETETGYPITFFDPLDPECDLTGDFCYQIWSLQTTGAVDVMDFSGFKLLKWDVCKNGIVIGHVSANLDLHAKHMGEQIHLDGKVDAAVTLYKDSEFTEVYHCSDLIDCELLYGKLCLTNYDHLDVEIRKAYICFSVDRDLIPFDPSHPSTTGCNTPGDDVVKVLIYSTNPWEEEFIDPTLHGFEIVDTLPFENECELFDFRVLAYTRHKQSLQIVWCAHENGGLGGLVESISEYQMDDGSFNRFRRDHQEEDHDFLVHCPDDWLFDWDVHRCHNNHHHSMEDEGDEEADEFGGILVSILFLVLVICLFLMLCHNWHSFFVPVPPPADYVVPYPEQQATPVVQQQQQQQQHIHIHNAASSTPAPAAYPQYTQPSPSPRQFPEIPMSIPDYPPSYSKKFE